MTDALALDDDRLFPSDPTRGIARRIFGEVRNMPIVSPHGHVPAGLLADNDPFPDPAALFVTPDHYVTRMLHANGIDLARLGLAGGADPREVWRIFCDAWPIFDGTASSYWLTSELVQFGVTQVPSREYADGIFDQLVESFSRSEHHPQQLFNAYGIETLATTDDPMDSLDDHRRLREHGTLKGRVIPTFRPDAYIDPGAEGWSSRVDALCGLTGDSSDSLTGLLNALQARREHFVRAGATASDHGMLAPRAVRLEAEDAARLYHRARTGSATHQDLGNLQAHLLWEMARMSHEDGLVMTIHAGVFRNHHTPTFQRFGPDSGHDIPVPTTFVEGLRPILESFGDDPAFRLILFTVDETTWSRELAPLAGFYPAVRIGAPWWFLDSPAALMRFRAATTDITGFTRSSGFIDDTRGFCSIPARHDLARRVDAAYLAGLVAEHRLSESRAVEVARYLVGEQPRDAFKL